MRLVLKHVKHNPKANSWHYRRGVPKALQDVIGKREQKKKLGNTESEAIKAYPKVHKAFDAELKAARLELIKQSTATNTSTTPFYAFRKAMELSRELGCDPDCDGVEVGSDEETHRSVLTDTIAQKYPEDPETGHPVGVTPVDSQLVRLLNSDTKASPPPITFLDAVELYIEHKLDGDEVKIQRCRRVAQFATTAWNRDPELKELGFVDGVQVLDHLKSTTRQSSATHKRYFNDLKSIVNYAIRVLDLKDTLNPFSNVGIKSTGRAKDKRQSFPVYHQRVWNI